MPPKKKIRSTVCKKKSKIHTLPPSLPEGEIITDIYKKQWRVGPSIGFGGFGLIYLTSDDVSKKASYDNSNYVLKIEPKSNGPLFCEINCYMKIAHKNLIDQWKRQHKINHLGMPVYISSGQHILSSIQYRFLVMKRFNSDVQKLFEDNGRMFDIQRGFSYAKQVLDVLEYIHLHGYVHCDIKGSNLLTDMQDSGKIYLVDFGLATLYTQGLKNDHKIYKEDKRKCHDGTIEFTSLDAHRGADPSRRSDIEILGYCLLQWIISRLPWEDNLVDKKFVMEFKEKLLNDPEIILNDHLSKCPCIKNICELFSYIKKLEYDEAPNYQYLHTLMVSTTTNFHNEKKSATNDLSENDNEDSVSHNEVKKKLRIRKPVIRRTKQQSHSSINNIDGVSQKSSKIKSTKK